jgi:cytoskeletal protein RodZ
VSIGATLSAGRAAAGLTVDDVSAATRVRGSLIRQIERDEFAGCGGAIYARGHIRSIASVVGVDAEPLVAEFNALHGGPGGPAVRQVLERPELVQGRTSPNWTAAMFVVAVLLAGVAFVALFTGGGTPAVDPIAGGPVTATTVPPSQAASQPAAAQASRQPAPETSAGTTAATTEPAATATSTPPAVVALSGVNVRVTVSGAKCWMRVSDGSAAGPGKVLFEDTLDHGVTREFTATRKLSLLIGNAGAVTLNVNGRDVGIAGKPGQVVTLPFEAGDPNAG